MNDVDFPVSACSTASRPPRDAGPRPIKVNMVVKRGVNDHSGRRAGALLPRHGPSSCASSNTWTSAPPTAGASTTWSRPLRSCALIDAELPHRASRRELPWRGSPTLALSGRCRRDRGDRVGDPAVLRELHALADLGRGSALHVPVRRPKVTTYARSFAGVPTTRRCTTGSDASGAGAPTATRTSARR